MAYMGKSREWWLSNFTFDLEGGKIYRKVPWKGNHLAFDTKSTIGYKEGKAFGIRTYAHRLIYFIGSGSEPSEVDHINGDRCDNRFENLREVSRKENSRNRACRSPVVGVGWDPTRCKWRSQIMVDGKSVFLGRFDCFGQAVKVRMKANRDYGFHENHGRKVLR